MWKPSSGRCARTGLTLIEVVAGIALLATLLVSVLAAYRDHARQIKRASARLSAVNALDDLLAQFHDANKLPPPGSAGDVVGIPNLRWQASQRASDIPQTTILAIAVLESTTTQDEALAKVELLVRPGESNEPTATIRP